jgi:hypothetical protein
MSMQKLAGVGIQGEAVYTRAKSEHQNGSCTTKRVETKVEAMSQVGFSMLPDMLYLRKETVASGDKCTPILQEGVFIYLRTWLLSVNAKDTSDWQGRINVL